LCRSAYSPGRHHNQAWPATGDRGARRELFFEIADDEVGATRRRGRLVNSQIPAQADGSSFSLQLQLALEAVRHRGKGTVGLAQRGDSRGPQRTKPSTAATSLRSGSPILDLGKPLFSSQSSVV
jgi:hypothetical protein